MEDYILEMFENPNVSKQEILEECKGQKTVSKLAATISDTLCALFGTGFLVSTGAYSLYHDDPSKAVLVGTYFALLTVFSLFYSSKDHKAINEYTNNISKLEEQLN